MNNRLPCLGGVVAALALLAAMELHAESAVQVVRSVDQLAQAAASARPGTTIELAAGDYPLNKIVTLTAHGTAEQPVIVRAQRVGAVRLVGKGSVRVRGAEWLVIDGFAMEYAAQTLLVAESNHVRLTRLKLAYQMSDAVRQGKHVNWIRIKDGTGHRVDHCDVGPHIGGFGVTLLVDNDARDVTIDHNYFHDRPRAAGNGAETIRLGSGGGFPIGATIEANLFENCDGEIEVISMKSDGNTVRGNTFRNNTGEVVVRKGGNIVIEGNQFISDDASRQIGGVRVHGSHIRVTGNYFENVSTAVLASGLGYPRTGPQPGPAEQGSAQEGSAGQGSAEAGADEEPATGAFYWQATDVEFTNNVVVDDDAIAGSAAAAPRANPVIQLELARKKEAAAAEKPPEGWTIANNIFVTAGPLVGPGSEQAFKWEGNTIWDRGGEPDVGRKLGAPQLGRHDPQLERTTSGWRASAGKAQGNLPPGLAKKATGSTAAATSAPPSGAMLPPPLTKAQVGPESGL